MAPLEMWIEFFDFNAQEKALSKTVHATFLAEEKMKFNQLLNEINTIPTRNLYKCRNSQCLSSGTIEGGE